MRALITSKQKPIIVVGLGLEPNRPYADIQHLAEALGAPVIDTPKSKGALPAQHPLYAGTIGLTRTDPAYEILDESDCILAIGFDAVELVKPWNQSQSLIWIANWANQDPRIPCDIEYIGDITPLLQKLASTCEQSASDNWGETRLTSFHERLNAVALPTPQDGRTLPQHVLQAIRNTTPEDIIITTDVGSHKIFTALNWKTQAPNSYFVSNGLSAMGFGLVSAVAAAHTTGKPAICITGDAGLAMGIGELILLKDYALPVIIVVMNDTALDLIRSAQKRRNRPVFGTEFSNPDYSLLAKAYTLDYAQIRDSATSESAITSALASGRPTLIEAMIDPISYPTTVK
jgi:acetolactate synthase-1/2/3 large subunit